MKKTLLIGLCIFSFGLNIAVAATLGWHIWRDNTGDSGTVKNLGFEGRQADQLRKLMANGTRGAIIESRKLILTKRLELFDQLLQDPNNTQALEQKLNEISHLRTTMEKAALNKITNVLSQLPDSEKPAFINSLKQRACQGRGMGGRHGRGGMGKFCPVDQPPSE
jgi:hypothetical protein